MKQSWGLGDSIITVRITYYRPVCKQSNHRTSDQDIYCLLHIRLFFDVNKKTRLFKYIENFTTKKGKFSDKKIWFFHISVQNIDCGYSLEPRRRGGSNEYLQSMFWAEIWKIIYTPVNPSFTI